MLKSVVAVLAGFGAIAAAGIATDYLVERLAPNQFGPGGDVHGLGMLVFILTYTLAYCAGGGFLTAVLAKERAMGSAMILATLIVMMTVVNLALIPTALPLWWKVVALVLSGPFVLLGGWLRSGSGVFQTE